MTHLFPRRHVVLALILGLGALAPSPFVDVAAQADPARTSLALGMPLEPTTLDPTAAAPAAIREVTLYNIFEGLVRTRPDGGIAPLLADSWTISDDGLIYRFKLRRGVRFHDGAPFDAATAKFTFERAMAPQSTNAQKQIFAPIAAIDAPAPDLLEIRLSRPSPNFLFQLSWGDAVMVAPNSAESNRTRPIGTGPFRFVRWQRGERIDLDRNPAYWDPARTRLEKITFRFIADPQAQVAALRGGDLDAFPNLSAPELFDALRGDARFVAQAGNTEGEIILALNNARAPFDKPAVRHALAHAIDKQALIAAAYGGIGTPIGSHFSPNHPAFLNLAGQYPFDPARAKKLLADAGLPHGFSATLRLPPPAYARRTGEVIAAMLAAIDVKVTLEPIEFPTWIQQVFRDSQFDMTIIAHTEPLDIEIYGREKYYFNYGQRAAMHHLLDEIDRTLDKNRRTELYRQAQRQLADDQPNIFLFQLPKLGVWNAGLTGLWTDAPILANDMTGVGWR